MEDENQKIPVSSATSGWQFWAIGITAFIVGKLFGLIGCAVVFGAWFLIDHLRKKQ